MTTNIHSFTVVFDKDLSEEGAVKLRDAVLCLKGVLGVEFNVSNCDTYVATSRARSELGQKLLEVLFPSK